MNQLELPHDKTRFGPLRAALDGRPQLVRLVALIRAFAAKEDRAMAEAANIVLDRLLGLELFELRMAGDAQRVGPKQPFNFVWPQGPCIINCTGYGDQEAELRRGPSGALTVMRRHWAESSERDPICPKTGWDTDECAGLAILRNKAEALFPEVFGATATVQAPALALVPSLVAPAADELAPLDDFNPAKWRPHDRRQFGKAYAAAKRTMKKSAALDALAQAGWAAAGSTLQKRITEANDQAKSDRKALNSPAARAGGTGTEPRSA